MKYAIYTAIYGGKDYLTDDQANCSGDMDYICFTDDPDLKSNTWNVVKSPSIEGDPRRSARVYKLLPHNYLSEYDASIWVDGNCKVKTDVLPLIKECLEGSSLQLFKHDVRNCIYEESRECIRCNLDAPQIINDQINRYKDNDYPADNGLVLTGVQVRNHHDPVVVKNMEEWYNEVITGSCRDQLSFNYVMWKNGFNYNFIPGGLFRNNQYFQIHGRNHKK
jgi:hypothetical protein